MSNKSTLFINRKSISHFRTKKTKSVRVVQHSRTLLRGWWANSNIKLLLYYSNSNCSEKWNWRWSRYVVPYTGKRHNTSQAKIDAFQKISTWSEWQHDMIFDFWIICTTWLISMNILFDFWMICITWLVTPSPLHQPNRTHYISKPTSKIQPTHSWSILIASAHTINIQQKKTKTILMLTIMTIMYKMF